MKWVLLLDAVRDIKQREGTRTERVRQPRTQRAKNRSSTASHLFHSGLYLGALCSRCWRCLQAVTEKLAASVCPWARHGVVLTEHNSLLPQQSTFNFNEVIIRKNPACLAQQQQVTHWQLFFWLSFLGFLIIDDEAVLELRCAAISAVCVKYVWNKSITVIYILRFVSYCHMDVRGMRGPKLRDGMKDICQHLL